MTDTDRRPALTPAQWALLSDILVDASALDADDRRAFVATRCGDDAVLRDEVNRLVDVLDQPGPIDRPPVALFEQAMRSGAEAAPSLVGTRVGAYDVVRQVGHGGMGAIYEAVRADDQFTQRVAIKTIRRGASSEAVLRRFRTERQILARLQHPNIAQLYNGGVTADDTPYFVMEFVDGVPIDRYCGERRVPVAGRLRLLRQVCWAVEYAHRHLVIHRDLKPANILVTADGTVKLLDFGIARITDPEGEQSLSDTAPGLSPMTVSYASPEQLRGDSVTTLTDVYSLGVVCYQLLAGVTPFPSANRSAVDVIRQVTDSQPAAPSAACSDEAALQCGLGARDRLARVLRGELDAIVLMALRKEPSRRYQSVEALGEDLDRVLANRPVTARPDTIAYRVAKLVRRQRALVGGGVIAVLALAGGAVLRESQARVAAAERHRSEQIAGFMQSILGAGDAMLGTSGAKVGPLGSVEELLDAAALRVPREFGDDAFTRARLYTTIGSGYITRSRMREAAVVLDSAIALARATYGPASAEYAFANLEASQAAVHRNRVGEAAQYVTAARAAIAAARLERSDLQVRALRDLATVRLLQSDPAGIDSAALAAIDLDRQLHATPTAMRAAVFNRHAFAVLMRRGPVAADSAIRTALATYDSSGAPFSIEMADILSNAAIVAFTLGQLPRADSLCGRGRATVAATLGQRSREAALFGACTSLLEIARGDTAAARRHVRDAVHIADSIPDVSWFIEGYLVDAADVVLGIMGDWAAADSIAGRFWRNVRGFPSAWVRAQASLTYGHTRGMLRDFPQAEVLLTDAMRTLDSIPSPPAQLVAGIRYQLAAVVARSGQDQRADSLYALLPPGQASALKAYVASQRPADRAAMTRRAREP